MNEKDFKDWMKRIGNTSGRKIQESDLYTALVTKNFLENPQCALEIGFAILMDKPIAILALDGVEIPENLRKVATIIENVEASKEGMQKGADAIKRHFNSDG